MFSSDELAHLRGQPVARLATPDAASSPTWCPSPSRSTKPGSGSGGGATVVSTRKIRNIVAGRRRVGLGGPGTYVRITAEVSWSWNLDGRPAADEWYPTTRTDHSAHG